MDCPPSLGMLTINVLSADDEILIPVQAEYLPAKAITKLIGTVSKVQRQINPNLSILGAVITMADMRTNMVKSTVEALREGYGRYFKIFDSIIPYTVKAKESRNEGKSVYSYAQGPKVAEAYDKLTKEIIKTHKIRNKDYDAR